MQLWDRIGSAAVILLTLFIGPVKATRTGDHLDYLFKGHLVQQNLPCSVNDGKVITISFGNVSISKVADGQYLQAINYTLDCGSATSSNTVSMTMKATSTDWDVQAMASSVAGLGIRILNSGDPIDLNSAINIDPGAPPTLQAQLVTAASAQLKEQEFTAGGTLMAEYQ